MGLGSGIRDPGSGKNIFRIPDPGVKKAPDPGSGSATLSPICFHLNRIGNGNDDIASEEHFENLKTRRGSDLGL